MTLLGCFLGSISVIGDDLEVVALVIVAISVAPLLVQAVRRRSADAPKS